MSGRGSSDRLRPGANKASTLREALDRFVLPGMHLNFASTPSRSNAAIRELARRFRGEDPEFVCSATGFHSFAHLLPLLGLGRQYIACFFGDNYPSPRPNRLYRELARRPALLEHWSLWAYVSALRAGAFGQEYAVTSSLSGTSLGDDLCREGKFIEVEHPLDTSRRLGLVRAIVPDIVFLHAAAGDREGNLLLAPPASEGIYGALGARLGVIATVDRLLSSAEIARYPELRPLPAHRVLAVCEEPFGAHPQPLHFSPAAPSVRSYRDDYEHYALWRGFAEGSANLAEFSRLVLDAEDGAAGYQRFVGAERFASLCTKQGRAARPEEVPVERARPSVALPRIEALSEGDRLLVLGARTIVRRVARYQWRCILAGLGQSFAAVRLAQLLLERDFEPENRPEVMIETGFAGIDVEHADEFLLSQSNVASAERLASVDVMLGALTCGANQCLGVIGAAQVDQAGNVNSSWSQGEFLVGSGGASDIAASAEDVLVLTPCDPRRLVTAVEYITSPGRRVRTVVTSDCVLERELGEERWRVRDALPSAAGPLTPERLAERCPWPLEWPEVVTAHSALSELEARFLARNAARLLSPRVQKDPHA